MNPMPPMTPAPAAAMSDAAIVVTLVLLLLAPLAIAGLTLINTGLGRSRSAAQAMLGSLALIAVAAIVFALIGAGFTGTAGMGDLVLHAGGKTWSILGLGPFFLRGLGTAAPQAQLGLLFRVSGRRHGRAGALGLGRGSLAARGRRRVGCGACRLGVSSCSTLDLGRRMACRSWAQTSRWARAFWMEAAPPQCMRSAA